MPRNLHSFAAMLTAIVVLIAGPVSGQSNIPGARPTDPEPPSGFGQSSGDEDGPQNAGDDRDADSSAAYPVVCQTSRGYCQGFWPRPVASGQSCRCGDIPGQVQ